MSVLVRGTPQYELTLFVAAGEGEDELEYDSDSYEPPTGLY